jgi:hydroxymethylpyrimidine pyrophosphatase-like HAD family hydrolase
MAMLIGPLNIQTPIAAFNARSGLSIAMGNASPEAQRAARRITPSNEEEGFATAVDRFILRRA